MNGAGLSDALFERQYVAGLFQAFCPIMVFARERAVTEVAGVGEHRQYGSRGGGSGLNSHGTYLVYNTMLESLKTQAHAEQRTQPHAVGVQPAAINGSMARATAFAADGGYDNEETETRLKSPKTGSACSADKFDFPQIQLDFMFVSYSGAHQSVNGGQVQQREESTP